MHHDQHVQVDFLLFYVRQASQNTLHETARSHFYGTANFAPFRQHRNCGNNAHNSCTVASKASIQHKTLRLGGLGGNEPKTIPTE